MLDLTGICAGSLHRECLRQGQGFDPPGDAAEGERGWVFPPGWVLPVFLFSSSFTTAISHHRFFPPPGN